MAVLITGGAGFVGSHLVDRLAATERDIIVMDDLSTGRLANLAPTISSGRTTFIYANVAVDADAIRAILTQAKVKRLTAIYHLASPASPSAYGAHPWETLQVNAIGTMSLIEIALEHGATFFYTSTSEVYGDPLVHPQPESYFGNVNPIGPRSCYDEGKRFGEAAVAAAIERRGLDGRIVRLFNCYGPRMESGDGRLIPEIFRAIRENRPMPIHGKGLQTRSLTYIDDIIEGFERVIALRTTVPLPYNLGSEEEHTVEEIARTAAEVAGVPYNAEYLPRRPEDPERRRPSIERARAIGWEPKTSLVQGLEIAYNWFIREEQIYA